LTEKDARRTDSAFESQSCDAAFASAETGWKMGRGGGATKTPFWLNGHLRHTRLGDGVSGCSPGKKRKDGG